MRLVFYDGDTVKRCSSWFPSRWNKEMSWFWTLPLQLKKLFYIKPIDVFD